MPQYSYPIDFEGTFWTVTDGAYYVSTVGNDISGDGSPKNPFLTVAKAFELSIEGEKIVIGPNEYIGFEVGTTGGGGTELPCRIATTSNIALETGGLMTIDGVLVQEGDRVLVWQQNGPAQNGIYLASSGSWQRDPAFNNAENIIQGKLVPILDGGTYAKTIFQLTTTDSINVGTTHLTFEKAAVTDWGEIDGVLSEQTDLQDALDLKADKSNVLELDNTSAFTPSADYHPATRKFVQDQVGTLDKATPKGLLDASTNPHYPAGVTGDYYYVSVAGKVGGTSGERVQVGDKVQCIADNGGGTQGTVGASWITFQGNLDKATTTDAQTGTDDEKYLTPAKGYDGWYSWLNNKVVGELTTSNQTIVGAINELVAGGGVVSIDGTPTSGQFAVWTNETTIQGSTTGLRWSYPRILMKNSFDELRIGSSMSTYASVASGSGVQMEIGTTDLSIIASVFPAQDDNSNPLIKIIGNQYDKTNLINRPVLAEYNNETKLLEVAASGTRDYQGNLLKNLADPMDPQDAATKAYVDSAMGNDGNVLSAGGANDAAVTAFTDTDVQQGEVHIVPGLNANQILEVFKPGGGLAAKINASGSWDLQSNKITSLGAPVNPGDAATKAYVDANAGGVSKSGTPSDNQIAVFANSNTIEGSTNFLFDNATKRLTVSGNSSQMFLGTETANRPAVRAGNNDESLTLSGGPILDNITSGAFVRIFGVSGPSPSDIQYHANNHEFYVDSPQSLAAKLNANGSWDFQANLLRNLADPVSAQDAATKAYVDANAGGLINNTGNGQGTTWSLLDQGATGSQNILYIPNGLTAGSSTQTETGIWFGNHNGEDPNVDDLQTQNMTGILSISQPSRNLMYFYLNQGNNTSTIRDRVLSLEHNSNGKKVLMRGDMTIQTDVGNWRVFEELGLLNHEVGGYPNDNTVLTTTRVINSAYDTGLNPVEQLSFLTTSNDAVINRDLLHISNGANDILRLKSNGTWDFQSNLLKNLVDPIDPQDAATKAYVDASGGSGNINKVGTPADNQMSIWSSSNEIEGASNLLFNGLGIDLESANPGFSAKVTVSTGSAILQTRNDLNRGFSMVSRGSTSSGTDFGISRSNLHVLRTGNTANAGIAIGTGSAHSLFFGTNEVSRLEITSNGDIVADGAAGGGRGPGTINAKGLFIDGVALSSGGGNVTKVGTPANNQLAVWTGDGTVEGNPLLTYNNSDTLSINGIPLVALPVDYGGDPLYNGGFRFAYNMELYNRVGYEGYIKVHNQNSSANTARFNLVLEEDFNTGNFINVFGAQASGGHANATIASAVGIYNAKSISGQNVIWGNGSTNYPLVLKQIGNFGSVTNANDGTQIALYGGYGGTKGKVEIYGSSGGINQAAARFLTASFEWNKLAIKQNTTVLGHITPETDNAFDLGSASNRWDDIFATNSIIQTSDQRDKKSIKKSDLGLEFVDGLNPISFKWRKGGKRPHYGFIAQDVADLIGDQEFAGIIHDEASDKYGLRYNELIAPMTKAIQELSAKVKKLESELSKKKN